MRLQEAKDTTVTSQCLRRLTSELDRLRLERRPTKHEAASAASVLRNGGAAGYFFRHDFAEVGWLRPLAEAGVFTKYLGALRGKPALARWLTQRELADYLSRVAEKAPEQVAEVLKTARTKDVYATGQFIRTVVKMPEEQAAKLAGKVVEWCTPRNPFAKEEEIAELAQRLARKGHTRAAEMVLELLLRPVVDRRTGLLTGVFFGDDLREFVRGKFGGFAREFPELALGVAEKCLKKALLALDRHRAEMHKAFSGERPRGDYSGWRAAIEDDPQNGPPGFDDGLVEAVRDALGALVAKNPADAEREIARYLKHRRFIFRRIALHTLAGNHARFRRLAEQTAVSKSLFGNLDLYHEYWNLVPAVFDSLTPEERDEVVRWILDGGARESAARRKSLVRLRLQVLEGCRLPGRARKRLEELKRKHGPAQHPAFLGYTTSWAGSFAPGSPKSAGELERMSNEEVIRYLREWKPKEDRRPDDPSEEGLGSELRSVVAQDPRKRVGLADEIDKTKPGYVWSFLDGLREASRQGKELDWKPVLALCDRVVPRRRPEEWPDAQRPESKKPGWEMETTWAHVRRAVAMLLQDAVAEVEGRGASVGVEHLEQVQQILVRLVRDPEPTLEEENEREGGKEGEAQRRPTDWLNVAVNTNRGEAALALVRYAVRRGTGRTPGERLEPEVREALDGLARDPCRSIHAVLGAELWPLWWLDSGWVRSRLGELLPAEKGREGLWEAAWVSFLQYSRLNEQMHKELVEHYRRTIGLVAKRDERDPMLKGLCKHLAVLYVWEWDDPCRDSASLVREFYAVGADDAASELAFALGRLLRANGGQGQSAKEKWPTVRQLLEWRIGQIGRQPGEHVGELRQYARWFREIREQELAGIENMEQALRAVTGVAQTWGGVEDLLGYVEQYAESHACLVGELLEAMIRNTDRDAWMGRRDRIRDLVGRLFASGDGGAERAAVAVVEHLWREGFWEAYEQYEKQVAAATG